MFILSLENQELLLIRKPQTSDSVGVKRSGLRHCLGWQPALFMNADVGPELWRVLLLKSPWPPFTKGESKFSGRRPLTDFP